MNYIRELKEHEILSALSKNMSSEILFHHRKPTSTSNTKETAHPISAINDVYEHNYYLVHNGKVTNYEVLKNFHEHHYKIKYSTKVFDKIKKKDIFNDSECLLHELALYLEGKKTRMNIHGLSAFILLQTDKNDAPLKLYFGRNSVMKDLKMYIDKNEFIISSEGKGDLLEIDKLFTFDYKTAKVSEKDIKFVDWGTSHEEVNQKLLTNINQDDIEDTDYLEMNNSNESEIVKGIAGKVLVLNLTDDELWEVYKANKDAHKLCITLINSFKDEATLVQLSKDSGKIAMEGNILESTLRFRGFKPEEESYKELPTA